MQALAAYNETPWSINNFTLEDIYEKWSDEHFPTISQSNINGYKAAWKIFDPIKHMKMNDIKLDHLQRTVDTSGKNRPTLRKGKSLISQLFDYAIKHEYIRVEKSKIPGYINIDKAGIRTVPIHDRTYPFFQHFMNDTTNYLLHNSRNPWQYRNFYDSYWTPTMNQLNMEHRPHDTRHTCVSMLTAKVVDELIFKKIVGHAGNSVTQIVYTHVEIQQLLKEINKL